MDADPQPPQRSVAIAAGGLAVLGLGMLVVRNGHVPSVEEEVFRFVNGWPRWLYPLVWPFQQLGALVLGPLVAAVALALRRYRIAAAALLATVLKLVTERIVKALVTRERPGTSIGPDIELRGDVHAGGESFVSGHAVLVAALAGVVSPYLPGRWKVVPWLLVAAVMVGRVYVGAHNPLDVVCGAGLGLAIAGTLNLALRPRRLRWRSAGAIAGAAAMVAAAAGVGAAAFGSERAEAAPEAIVVGSFDFRESEALAEMYSQALEDAGFPVERAFGLGPREFVAPALASGLVDLVPEYAGTAAEFYSVGAAEPDGDEAATHRELVAATAPLGLVALDGAPAENVNTLVVTARTAARFGLGDVSDLAAVADQLTFGGPPECPVRALCLPGLLEVYGLQFEEFVPLDAGGPLTRQALRDGAVDVAVLFSTDPAIADPGLVELVDDRALQPAENVTPLIRAAALARWGDRVRSVVDAESARLTTAAVRRLNALTGDATGELGVLVASWRQEVALAG